MIGIKKLGVMLAGGMILWQVSCSNPRYQVETQFVPSFAYTYLSTLINYYVPLWFGQLPQTTVNVINTTNSTTVIY